MSPTIGLPPPPTEGILERSRQSRYKGGTLIAEEVCELSEHLARLSDADLYRPAECARCGHGTLHVHDHVERRPMGDPSLPPSIRVLVFRCASPSCGATWRVLPNFLARHLGHSWRAVERVVTPVPESTSAPTVSERTQQRWRRRLASSARTLVLLLAMAGGVLEALATEASLSCTRRALLEAFVKVVRAPPGMQLAALAAVTHRLERGVRLM
jgi:hypothetical protein